MSKHRISLLNTNRNDIENDKQEITLTIGLFFDGSGNNATNTLSTLNIFSKHYNDLNTPEAETLLAECAQTNFNVSGVNAISYTGYYTNIYWLSILYTCGFLSDNHNLQQSVYIDGIGTEPTKPDTPLGLVFGVGDTGVVAKTDKAVSLLAGSILDALNTARKMHPGRRFLIKSLQFDVFGFSRGAAAACHFANRIRAKDPAITIAVEQGIEGNTSMSSLSVQTRFIGLFDTVAAIGTVSNGLNPHSANAGNVELTLLPDVAENVFHITAANECRYNFPLNSVKPIWPELALPGTHSDIGGGYLPIMKEDLYLTRPGTETVPLNHPGEATQVYRQATAQLQILGRSLSLGPLAHVNDILTETWSDDRMPVDRYGQMQKRVYAALTLHRRIVRNNWSYVALQIMLEAAQDAGVQFKSINQVISNIPLPEDLVPLCDKALLLGKAVRCGERSQPFSLNEINILSKNYIHCSAHWGSIRTNAEGLIYGGAHPLEKIGFINRPDEQWKRTIYTPGEKIFD